MNSIYWLISCFEPNNSLPFTFFDEPLRPLISIMRANDKPRHIMTLMERNLLRPAEILSLVERLSHYSTIDVKKCEWTFDALSKMYNEYEKYLFMQNIIPLDTNSSKGQHLIYKVIKNIVMPKIYNPANFERGRILIDQLPFARVLLRDNGAQKNIGWYLFKNHFRIVLDKYIGWPYDILKRKVNANEDDIKRHLSYHDDKLGHAYAKVLMAYYLNENDVMPRDFISVFQRINDMAIQKIYACGNEGFYHFVADNANVKSRKHYVNRSLFKRAVLNQYMPDPTLFIDTINEYDKMRQLYGTAQPLSISLMLFWRSFMIAIGIDDAIVDALTDSISRAVDKYFIFGDSSIKNYERYLGASIEGILDMTGSNGKKIVFDLNKYGLC